MLTEEQAVNASEEVTDGCRRLVRVTSDNAPQWQRVKPDTETHLSAFNYLRCSRSGSRQPPLPRRVVAQQNFSLVVTRSDSMKTFTVLHRGERQTHEPDAAPRKFAPKHRRVSIGSRSCSL